MNSLIAGMICNLLQGCGPVNGYEPPRPPTNPNVIVYQVRPDSVPVQQVTFDSIANIGLDCSRKDLIINYIESQVPANAERRLNAIARTKIWQLRTHCQ